MSNLIITKSEFARKRGVSPQRVSQWIAEGKIRPPALVGDGRSAKINEAVAIEQLARRLDTNQRTGNGVKTKLAPDEDRDESRSTELADRLLKAKVRSAEMINQRLEEQELLRRGVLSETAAVRAAWSRGLKDMMIDFEGSFQGFASAIAASPGASAREIVIILRTEWRAERERLAAIHRARAEAQPTTVIWQGEPSKAEGSAVPTSA